MDKRKITHDIVNMLERLRIIHDLAIQKNFQDISKEEMVQDVNNAIKELQENFAKLLQ